MGIENDQLVFDYLSRIGDLAQQRQVPAAERRELVSGLRDEIERRRSVKGERVAGILGDLGTPDEVVDRVAPVPAPREPDWWRTDGPEVPGFVGGVEIPDLLKPPRPEEDPEEDDRAPGEASDGPSSEAEAPDGEPEARPRRRVTLRLGSPLLVASAVLLLAGAALGSLVALAAGWLLAYASRARRAAVLVIPGASATVAVVWLWGRVEGRWGAPVPPGGEAMGAAVSETWPWTLRAAAIASGLFLLWRSRRG
ncbi:hypothetical protein ACIGEZ_13075 [Streptomyces sp. NPDC085481]|uniref:hypothetical protein n=1 Tax=Streptomyces sp. NPDC085481 TaxID=3365727 RepID=UPI0037D2E2B5